jgi:DeoR family lactose phosphotransferase system repressor
MGMKNERLNQIKKIIDKHGYLSTVEIAEALKVSQMTVRRDLKELENKNEISRIYGGAQSIKRIQTEFTTNEKMKKNINEKKEIATTLNSFLPDNITVFLGAGTTLLLAAPLLVNKNLTFITNSLPAFLTLKKNNCHIILTGGELHQNTSEFLGTLAERAFDDLNIDYALCSTNGITKNNVTTSNADEGSIQNVAINHSKRKIIVADHSKFNQSDIITFRKLDEFDYLLTDMEISKKDEEIYSKYTKVIYKGCDKK